MASLIQLFSEWEIQMLVILSFMLQAFLFFGGGLRRRTNNGFLRILIWIAYLGADLVAAYALGLISRNHDDTHDGRDRLMGTHQLTFMWAPFLLIHLGGQDTITGFSLEDNNLWRRHLLNLVVQITLALYIFWKSANGPNKQFLAPSILLFVTGTIKYGERTWALRSGVLRTLAESKVPRYAHLLKTHFMESRPFHVDQEQYKQLLEQIARNDSSSEVTILSIAMCSIDSTLSFLWQNGSYKPILYTWVQERGDLIPKVSDILEIQLGLLYDYIYTKAVVFQTRGGIILRCISQTSFVASFLLFLVSNKQRYNSVDTAITYALFAGGLSLEVGAVFTTMMSPWTWAWLEARHCGFLAPTVMRWQRKRVLWSNSMGQYNLHSYLGEYDHHQQSSSWRQGVMARIRKAVDKTCGDRQKFWISKHLDTKFVKVDKEIMWCIFQKVVEYSDKEATLPQKWPNLGPLLQKLLPREDDTLDWRTIAALHTYTEAQLRIYSPSPSDVDSVLVRRLSNYMVYLLVTQPGMLPISKGFDNRFYGITKYFAKAGVKISNNTDMKNDPFPRVAAEILTKLGVPVPSCCTKEQLLETKEAWLRIVIYIASRSRPEMHAAQLARGGELLTFVWLFMAFKFLGDSVMSRINIIDNNHVPKLGGKRNVILFRLPPAPGQSDQTDIGSSSAH